MTLLNVPSIKSRFQLSGRWKALSRFLISCKSFSLRSRFHQSRKMIVLTNRHVDQLIFRCHPSDLSLIQAAQLKRPSAANFSEIETPKKRNLPIIDFTLASSIAFSIQVQQWTMAVKSRASSLDLIACERDDLWIAFNWCEKLFSLFA